MKKLLLLYFSLLFASNICFGQFVYDFSLNSSIKMDGLFLDGDTLYAAEGWNGTKIFKITPDGTVSIFASGLDGPIDIVRKSNGFFYVSEWNQSRISQISSTGSVSVYVNTSPGPGPMALDPLENIYVTHNINNGSGIITKITNIGIASIYASGSLLINPGGIIIDSLGNLFVSNFNNGNVIKIDSLNTMSLFATIPVTGTWKTGHMKYKNGDIYVSSISGQKVFKITPSGNVTTYAGSGVNGHFNSTAISSQLSNPDGLVFSKISPKLYISKSFANTNYIQVFDLSITSINKVNAENFINLKASPNPMQHSATISYSLINDSRVNLSLVSILGEVLLILKNDKQQKGYHEINFNMDKNYKGVASLILKTESSNSVLKLIFF